MKRVSSQLIYCSPGKLLRNSVVEQDEDGNIIHFFDLQAQQSETAQTLFFDGIISAEIISLKQYLSAEQIVELTEKYNYINIADNDLTGIPNFSDKPFVLDFGTNNITTINNILKNRNRFFVHFNAFQLIAACSYLPIEILNLPLKIQFGQKPNLLLWQGFDISSKKVQSQIRIIPL